MCDTRACHVASNVSYVSSVPRDTPAVTMFKSEKTMPKRQVHRNNNIPYFIIKGNRLKVDGTLKEGTKIAKNAYRQSTC